MRRKLCSILLFLSLFLNGCYDGEENDFQYQFDFETNQTVIFQGVKMSIPAEWEEVKTEDVDNGLFFEEISTTESEYMPLNHLSLLSYDDIDSLDEGFDNIEEIFSDENAYEIIKCEDLIIDGCEGKSLVAQTVSKSNDTIYFKQTLFNNQDRMILISFMCRNKYSLVDYDTIIDNVVVE